MKSVNRIKRSVSGVIFPTLEKEGIPIIYREAVRKRQKKSCLWRQLFYKREKLLFHDHLVIDCLIADCYAVKIYAAAKVCSVDGEGMLA